MRTALAGLCSAASPCLPALDATHAGQFALCSFAALLSTGLAGTLLGWWLRGR
jgi:hypothetical protein